MHTLDRQQLKELARARRRVPFRKIAEMPDEILLGFRDFHRVNRNNNILSDAIRQRSARNLETEAAAYLSENYAQIELQTVPGDADPNIRTNYIEPCDSKLVGQLETLVGACYRTRISTLKPGGRISRHIDDPRQLRVICILEGQHEFALYENNKTHWLLMEPGELWFVNTAWEHEVNNPGNTDRVALLANLFELPEK